MCPSIKVVGGAETGEAGLDLVRRLRPDVSLLDVELPDLNGFAVVRRVSAITPPVAVPLLTACDYINYIREMIGLGIRGYLQKFVPIGEIVAAVLAVAEGRTTMIMQPGALALDASEHGLTAPERGELDLLAAGNRNREIAEILGVTVKTVDFHVSRVLSKLGARSRAEAVRKATQSGLLLMTVAPEFRDGSLLNQTAFPNEYQVLGV
jgi:DNA-binding NarL/FixJ family response regulator